MADLPGDHKQPDDPAAAVRTQPIDVVLVGGGARASAWLQCLHRSARLRVVATAARAGYPDAPDVPRYESLDEAIGSHRGAAFAVTLPPRVALESALQLADAGAAAVVEAPLHDALIDVELGPGAAAVRVAHGWVTLPGVRTLETVMRRSGGGRLRIEVAGLPEADEGDLAEVLVHAAALTRALLPQATAVAARHVGGGALEVELTAPATAGQWSVHLRLLTRGRRLAVNVQGSAGVARWSWEGDRESVTLDRQPLIAPHATPPAPARALAQLLPDAPRGDALPEAAAALRLARSCLALLPAPVPLGARALRQSADIARRRPLDVLGRLGLRGQLDGDGSDAAARVLAESLPPEPFELWAFRAGVKPVAFLTVRPDQVERTLAWFGDVPFERCDRRVHIESQDRWTDRRDHGAPRVELYIAHDPALARRAAQLQADADPSRGLAELGALLGYPACCVQAFAQQDDRANNSRNRYYSAARTSPSQGPWPWELNNLHTVIVPFYPCSYRCERALAWARATLQELARAHPAAVETLRAALAQPVLYFDHDHQLVFDGESVDCRIVYRGVALTPSASPPLAVLATAISRGDRLTLDDRQLLVERNERVVLRLERTDPALGFIAPFAVA